MIAKIKTIIQNYRDRQLYNFVVTALANGYQLVSNWRWIEFETQRYIRRELGIDHINYQLQDESGNIVTNVPGYIVDMLPSDDYHKIVDSCNLGTFYRIEPVYHEYDNLSASEIYEVRNRFERANSIDRAVLVAQYPNALSDYAEYYQPTLAYDHDCKPTRKQAVEAFRNELLRQAKKERRYNDIYMN